MVLILCNKRNKTDQQKYSKYFLVDSCKKFDII